MADGFYGGTPRARAVVEPVIRGLGRLYRRADGIAPLEPDLIGEHHVVADWLATPSFWPVVWTGLSNSLRP